MTFLTQLQTKAQCGKTDIPKNSPLDNYLRSKVIIIF